MTWTSFHSRGETLRDVVAVADRHRDGLLPMQVPGVAETFGDEVALLGALLLRWHTRLVGRIERELAAEPLDLSAAVERAWRGTADENPGIHAIVDRFRSEPVTPELQRVLDVSRDKAHAVLAVSAGLSSLPATAATVRAGAELEARARVGHVLAPEQPAAPVTLLGRLRAALAA